MGKNQKLNFIYSAMMFFYFAAYCSIYGYATVYLLSRGFSNVMIGNVLAGSNLIAAFLQPLVGSYFDRHPHIPLQLTVISGAICMALANLSLNHLSNLFLLVALMFAQTLMISLMPFMNALAFIFEKQGIHIPFGLARGIGSCSYALCSFIIGKLAVGLPMSFLPYVSMGLCFFLFLFSLQYKNKSFENEGHVRMEAPSKGSVVAFILKYQWFFVFLLGSMCFFIGHAFLNNFMIQLITPIGGDTGKMGFAIFLAAILELPMMGYFEKMNAKIKTSYILIFSSFMFAFKHFILYIAHNMMMVYVSQIFQMFAYALYLPASVYFVKEVIAPYDQVKGQSLTTLMMTVASIIGTSLGGIFLDGFGVSFTLSSVAIISFVGAIVVGIALYQMKVVRQG